VPALEKREKKLIKNNGFWKFENEFLKSKKITVFVLKKPTSEQKIMQSRTHDNKKKCFQQYYDDEVVKKNHCQGNRKNITIKCDVECLVYSLSCSHCHCYLLLMLPPTRAWHNFKINKVKVRNNNKFHGKLSKSPRPGSRKCLVALVSLFSSLAHFHFLRSAFCERPSSGPSNKYNHNSLCIFFFGETIRAHLTFVITLRNQ
jgi:hypothetical protein